MENGTKNAIRWVLKNGRRYQLCLCYCILHIIFLYTSVGSGKDENFSGSVFGYAYGKEICKSSLKLLLLMMGMDRRRGWVGVRGRFSRLATEDGHFEVNAGKFSVRGSKAWIGGSE